MKKHADYIWINGEFLPWEESNIHIMTHSLHYAGAVYEGVRSYNGKAFLSYEHAQRLIRSAKAMGLDFSFTAEEIVEIIKQLLAKNDIQDSYIRPLVWRGAEEIKIYHKNLTTNFMVAALPSKRQYKNDIRLNVSKWRKAHPDSIDPQAKSSAHYATSVLVQKEANELGFDDSLQMDHDGNIAECTISNLFFAKGDKIYTPFAKNYLNGLTRQFIIKMATEMGYIVQEKAIKLEELGEYDTCFMTGTAVEIAGIELIDNAGTEYRYGNKIVPALQLEFAKRCGKEV